MLLYNLCIECRLYVVETYTIKVRGNKKSDLSNPRYWWHSKLIPVIDTIVLR